MTTTALWRATTSVRLRTTAGAAWRGPGRWRALVVAILILVGVSLLCGAEPGAAATFVVTTTADTNDGICDADCSLREAVIAANANPGQDVVELHHGTHRLSLWGTTEWWNDDDAAAFGDLDLTDDVILRGANRHTTLIDGRLLYPDQAAIAVPVDAEVTIENLTIVGRQVRNAAGRLRLVSAIVRVGEASPLWWSSSPPLDHTGAVHSSGPSLNLYWSVVSGSWRWTGVTASAGTTNIYASEISGGSTGVSARGTGTVAVVHSSTVSNNHFGVAAGSGSLVEVWSSTIADNHTGIYTGYLSPPIGLYGTLLANAFNCAEENHVVSHGYNLSDDDRCDLPFGSDRNDVVDARLGPLRDNGGPTRTHALLTGSPALDADNHWCGVWDQRGIPTGWGSCDIGAYERGVVVTKTDDTNDGSCDADCSLREAILSTYEVNGPGEVILPAGRYVLSLTGAGEGAGATGDLDVTDDVIIVGAGLGVTIIDGNGTDRVFDVFPDTHLELIRLSVESGRGNGAPGAGIQNSYGSVTLHDVSVRGNVADDYGGGGIANWGELALHGAEVLANSSANDGGGILNGGFMHAHDSVIANNTAADEGGGVHDTGTAIIDATLVSGNVAVTRGGGILTDRGTLLVRDSTLLANESESHGGGLYSWNAVSARLESSTLAGNRARGHGGGIYLEGGELVAKNTTISGNIAEIDGAALLNDFGSATLGHTTITQNDGYAIVNYFGGSVTLDHALIAENIPENCASATLTSAGHNLDDDGGCFEPQGGDLQYVDAALLPLEDNGGATTTHALGVTSPAFNGGAASCEVVDQRGARRPIGSACDIGAVEMEVDVDEATGDVAAGGSVTADGGAVETTVTSPNPGTISIREVVGWWNGVSAYSETPLTIVISAPPASPTDPIVISIVIDGDWLEEFGEDLLAASESIQIIKDGLFIKAPCRRAGIANPDPCVAERRLEGRYVTITILTSTASTWDLHVPASPPVLCVSAPSAPCRSPKRSVLAITDKDPDTGDKVLWKWLKGDATSMDDFGAPDTDADYALCVSDAHGFLFGLGVSRGGVCARGNPCWRPLGTVDRPQGYKYGDPEKKPHGVLRMLLRAGPSGASKAVLKGQGERLPQLGLALEPPVTARLVNSRTPACWEATYRVVDVQRNDVASFRAKASQ